MKFTRLGALVLAASPALGLLGSACNGDDDFVGGDDLGDASVSSSSSGGRPSSSSSGGSSSGSSSGGGGGSSSGDGGACDRTPRADDAPRVLAASRPYADQDATAGGKLSLFSLTTAGTITATSEIELAGVQSYGSIAFSPDGRVGALAYDAAPNDDDRGAVGVFRVDADGNATVVHAVYRDKFTSAEAVQFSPDGEWLYIVDGNTNANGGGVYAAKVGCDGTLGEATKVAALRSATIPFWLHQDPSRGLVAGDDFTGAPSAADSLHLLSFAGAQATRLGGADVTGTLTSIRYLAVSTDDKVAVLSAWNENLGGPRFIGVGLEGNVPSLLREWGPDQVLGGAEVALASPFGNAFFFTSAFRDRAYRMTYDPAGVAGGDAGASDAGASDAGDAAAPSVFGPLEVIGTGSVPPLVYGNPQLASTGMVITRGALKGRIVIGEVTALRQFQFNADGTITDVARLEMPGGEDDITSSLGSIGVTP